MTDTPTPSVKPLPLPPLPLPPEPETVVQYGVLYPNGKVEWEREFSNRVGLADADYRASARERWIRDAVELGVAMPGELRFISRERITRWTSCEFVQ
ncbi:hypothetical protein ACFWGP_05575 [Agromyces sp. NPDC127015]|uniref:hypothetical protein n=1 Tax=Agromyces sp. NPDC127015 TaxID=3347108 RepID=UPI003651F3EE